MDVNILLFIQEYLQNPYLTNFFRFITFLGNAGIIWILISLILIYKKDNKQAIGLIISLIVSAVIANLIIKPLVNRPRVFNTYSNIVPLINKPTSSSFPSGHTATSIACGTFLYDSKNKYRIFTSILAVLIAISRLYLLVHYPTDVLVGSIIGLIVGKVVYYFVEKYAK